MTHAVTKNCIRCDCLDRVETCPVHCSMRGRTFR